MSNQNKVRVATVKADGRRYLVQRLDMPKGRPVTVMCWGEVLETRGLASKHGPSVQFDRTAVDLTEEVKTPELLRAMFVQMAQVQGRSLRTKRGGGLAAGRTAAEAEMDRKAAEAMRPAVEDFRALIAALSK